MRGKLQKKTWKWEGKLDTHKKEKNHLASKPAFVLLTLERYIFFFFYIFCQKSGDESSLFIISCLLNHKHNCKNELGFLWKYLWFFKPSVCHKPLTLKSENIIRSNDFSRAEYIFPYHLKNTCKLLVSRIRLCRIHYIYITFVVYTGHNTSSSVRFPPFVYYSVCTKPGKWIR